MGCTLTILSKFCCFWSPGPFLATGTHPFWSSRAPRSFLGDRYTPFFGCTGSKILSWRLVHTFFWVHGLQDPFLATGTQPFLGARAPRSFLGDRYTPFLGFPGSKILSWRLVHTFFWVPRLQELFLATGTHPFWGSRAPRSFSWRPVHTFFWVHGLQDPFLATGTHLFLGARAPRSFLGDRYTPFFELPSSKNPSRRPLHLYFLVTGLQELN
jgi:hypothetical protein